MKNNSYRDFHASYMENHNGTSIWENMLVVTPTPILLFYISLIKMLLYYNYKLPKGDVYLTFILDFTLLIMPLILICTVLNSQICNIIAALIIGLGLLITYLTKGKKNMFFKILNTPIQQEKKPYITFFRSAVSIYSVICILGVDFQIFPRRFAKTETFGYSLMDTGVGFYLLANGIVVNKNIKNQPYFIFKTLLSCFPILLLGFVRLIFIENLNYQKHVSEYGIHWNFFFTLSIVKLIGSFLVSTFHKRLGLMAAVIGILHQIALTQGIQEWVLSGAPRDNFFTSNREGIISIPGYISLYLSGVAMGVAMRCKILTIQDAFHHAFKLAVGSIVFIALTIISENWFGVSRRLANGPYILWMTSLTLFVFCICLLTEVGIRTICILKKVPVKAVLVPGIYDAINYNGLAFFILANINTGLVNLSLKTLTLQSLNSVIILVIYMFTNCCVTSVLYHYNLKLKLVS